MEILFVVLLLVMFWLLLIRPAQRRQKAQQQLQNSLEVGSEVMLTSGVFGTLTDVGDSERLRLLIADGVEIEVVRAAVAAVVPDEAEPDEAERIDDTEIADPADPAETHEGTGDGPVDLDKP